MAKLTKAKDVVKPKTKKSAAKSKPAKKEKAKPEKAVKKRPKRAADDAPAFAKVEGLSFDVKTSDKGLMRVSVVSFNDSADPSMKLDLRSMYKSSIGETLPTRKGLMIPLDRAERLHRRLGKLIQKAKKKGYETEVE